MAGDDQAENGNDAKSKSSHRTLTFLLGGILGVAFVRYVVLDPLEIIGWSIFWNGLFEGGDIPLGRVFGSATFLKCAAGFIVGGFLGQFRMGSKKEKQDEEE